MQRFTLALLLLFTSLCGQLFGQASATGAVNGPVTDPAGLVVAGAKVVLLNESTNLATSVTTNAEGQYRIQNLLPAVYMVTVAASGFRVVQVAARSRTAPSSCSSMESSLGGSSRHLYR